MTGANYLQLEKISRLLDGQESQDMERTHNIHQRIFNDLDMG